MFLSPRSSEREYWQTRVTWELEDPLHPGTPRTIQSDPAARDPGLSCLCTGQRGTQRGVPMLNPHPPQKQWMSTPTSSNSLGTAGTTEKRQQKPAAQKRQGPPQTSLGSTRHYLPKSRAAWGRGSRPGEEGWGPRSLPTVGTAASAPGVFRGLHEHWGPASALCGAQ